MPMHSIDEIIASCRVEPGAKFRLKDHDPGWAGDESVPKKDRRRVAEQLLSQDVSDLAASQELLYAADSWAVLLIFQALDSAGKDGTIKHVMSGVNPQGCQVTSFKHPSAKELEHTFLWRCTLALPERGRIGIFNRSYYEEALIVRVHPELIAAQRLPGGGGGKKFWDKRFNDINNFERHLVRNGTIVLKFFLNLSKEEQRKRFLARINDPQKHWKFSPSDIHERQFWDKYQEAYEECLRETSTRWAPWYVVPADNKWITRAIVSSVVVRAIQGLKLRYPEVSGERLQEIAAAKALLELEMQKEQKGH
ncbi:MAG TPA: polyphosphate kinase 2 family protein [Gemmatales bacterium]|nr:polyphosphate kinase 2 family protein [Gemmatales bacterium]